MRWIDSPNIFIIFSEKNLPPQQCLMGWIVVSKGRAALQQRPFQFMPRLLRSVPAVDFFFGCKPITMNFNPWCHSNHAWLHRTYTTTTAKYRAAEPPSSCSCLVPVPGARCYPDLLSAVALASHLWMDGIGRPRWRWQPGSEQQCPAKI